MTESTRNADTESPALKSVPPTHSAVAEVMPPAGTLLMAYAAVGDSADSDSPYLGTTAA